MILNDAYWEMVSELPPELTSEEEYRTMQAQELCDEWIKSGFCETCQYYNECEYRSKSI